MTRVVLCVQNMDVPDDPRVWNEATSLAGAGYDVTVVAPRSAGALARGTDRRRRRHPLPDCEAAARHVGTTARGGLWLRRYGSAGHADPQDGADRRAARRQPARHVVPAARGGYAAPEPASCSINTIQLRSSLRRSWDAGRCSTACSDPSSDTRTPPLTSSSPATTRVASSPSTAADSPPSASSPSGSGLASPSRSLEPPVIPTAVFAGVIGSQDTVEVLIDAFAEVLRRRPGAAPPRAHRNGRRRRPPTSTRHRTRHR